MSRKYSARVLTDLTVAWLRERRPEAVIVRELSCGRYGSAQLDVAAITPTELIGVEVKGEGDSAARLPLQALLYSAVATEMHLFPAPSLEKRMRGKLPPMWRLLSVGERDEGVVVRDIRGASLPQSPRRLCELLWRDELSKVARSLRLDVGYGRFRYDVIANEVADIVPLRELRPAVYAQLYRRDWPEGRALQPEQPAA